MRARALVLLVALSVPALSPAVAVGPAAFTCDTPVAGLPCNLLMTFGAHRGNEVHIAMNPANPDNVVATSKDYGLTGTGLPCSTNNVWGGYYTTLDSGQTWVNGWAPGHAGGPPSPISSYRCSTDPVVGFDSAGTAYLSGLAINGSGGTSAVWVAKSTDGGLTFPQLAKADESNFNDKNWLAVDPASSNVYVTWTQFTTGNGIWFRRSLGGDITTWGPRIQLSGASSGSAQGSFPLVGPDGAVHVVWNNNINGGSGSMLYVKSTDQGATFTAERSLFTFNAANGNGDAVFRTPTIPAFAVDRSGGATHGNLYLVWQDKRHGDSDAFFARSTDGGLTWGSHVRLNDDAPGNGKGQNFPTIAVDNADGSLHVTWIDRRDDPANNLFNTYYTRSGDGGLTWAPNQRVSTHSSSPTPCVHQNGFTFIGDYMGIAAGQGRVRPAFPDTRHGRCDLFTATLVSGPRLAVDAPGLGAIGQPFQVDLDVLPASPVADATLELDLPLDWAVDDADGGTLIPGSTKQTVRWALGAFSSAQGFQVQATPGASASARLDARLAWALDGGIAGLELWNRTVLVSYPVLELDLQAPGRAGYATAFEVDVVVRNTGSGLAEDATLTLALPAGPVAVPRGAGVDPEAPAVGLSYGIPAADPALLPAQLAWDLGDLAPGSEQTFRLVLLAPVKTASENPAMLFTAVLAATAPDGAALGGTRIDVTRALAPTPGEIQATPGLLAAYLTA